MADTDTGATHAAATDRAASTSSSDARAARLAAIEARLNPPKDDDAVASQQQASGTPNAASSASSASGRGTNATPGTAGTSGTGWKRPNEREVTEKRRELARVLQRTIVRDSGYAKAADCVETLVKIATNILTSDEEKYRRLKVTNPVLSKKVFAVPGGREFMILMGFHSETHEMVQYFVMDNTERHKFKLELAAGVLSDALPDLQARVAGTLTSKSSHKAEEARRVALAKLHIEGDRDAVKDRIERERMSRIAREHVQARQAEDSARQADIQGGEDEDEEEIWGEGQRLGA